MRRFRYQSFIPLLGSRRLPWLLALLAMLFTLPSLWSGYYQDDHLIRLRFQGFPGLDGVQGKLLDTCVFGDGNPEQNHARMERGILPWWTPEDWKIAFWRPLTSLTHWFDWKVFGDHAWIMHVHSLFWYAPLVFVLTLLYRRFLTPPWVAGLAALLYLLDAAHGLTVAWIATRNALISSVFVVLVIYFHDRWRRDAWKPGMTAALLALAVGLLTSEALIAAGAYLAAYALFIDRGRWSARIASLLPYLVVVIVWRVIYQALGYGVAGTLLYIDPIAQPVQFAADVCRYLPLLLFCQFGASDPAVWSFLPLPIRWTCYAIALGFLIFVLRVLWPMLKREPAARFWALGMVLSALPVCTVMPQGRELMNPGIGAMALVAQFLGWRATVGPEALEPRRYQRIAGVLAGIWIFFHLAVSSISLPINSYTAPVTPERIAQRLNDTAPKDPTIANQTLIIVHAPADLLAATLPVMRAVAKEPVPKYPRTLCAGVQSLDIERTDDHTLVFRPDGHFMTRPWCMIFRDPATRPMHAGQTVHLTGLTATVDKVAPDGRPTEVKFLFDVPLEDPSIRWVVFRDHAYVPFIPPPVGATVHVAGLTYPEIVRWFLTQ